MKMRLIFLVLFVLLPAALLAQAVSSIFMIKQDETVSISETLKRKGHGWELEKEAQSAITDVGTGFALQIGQDIFVVTCAHVVDRHNASVCVYQGKTYPMILWGIDTYYDLAFLVFRNPSDAAKIVAWETEVPKQGMIISSLDYKGQIPTGSIEILSTPNPYTNWGNLIVHSAIVEHGFSGGPLIHKNKLLGMNVLTNRKEKKGYALSILDILACHKRMNQDKSMGVKHIQRPFLGLAIKQHSIVIEYPFITHVFSQSAFKKEIPLNSKIIAINGISTPDFQKLVNEIENLEIGKPVCITIRPPNSTIDIDITKNIYSTLRQTGYECIAHHIANQVLNQTITVASNAILLNNCEILGYEIPKWGSTFRINNLSELGLFFRFSFLSENIILHRANGCSNLNPKIQYTLFN